MSKIASKLLWQTINPLIVKGNHNSSWNIVKAYLIAECGGVCQRCSKLSKRLFVHHIDGCGLNNQRDNLIVVCAHCHGQLHHKLNTTAHGFDPIELVRRSLNKKWKTALIK